MRLLPARRPVAGPVRASNSLVEVVDVACHDLRGQLAALYGLARTLRLHPDIAQRGELVRLLGACAQQFRDLLGDLELITHIDGGRFEPIMAETNALELARAAAAEPSEIRIAVSGDGAPCLAPPHQASRALARLAKYAAGLGGREEIDLTVRGTVLELSPISRHAARFLMDAGPRPLAVATAVVLIDAIGGSIRVDGERLLIRLPE
jgi:signal transduction histidine kinase